MQSHYKVLVRKIETLAKQKYGIDTTICDVVEHTLFVAMGMEKPQGCAFYGRTKEEIFMPTQESKQDQTKVPGKHFVMSVAVSPETAEQFVKNVKTRLPELDIAEITDEVAEESHLRKIADRSKAIHNVIQCAKAGDCILIAGKGAETYQQIGDQKFPFNDVEKVREILLDARLA